MIIMIITTITITNKMHYTFFKKYEKTFRYIKKHKGFNPVVNLDDHNDKQVLVYILLRVMRIFANCIVAF